MINFKREGTTMVATIEAKCSVPARWYTFKWNCTDDVYADLLVKAFEANLEEHMKNARRESYEQGFKDAKAKRRREDWFSGHI